MSVESPAPSPELLTTLLSKELAAFTPFERALDGLDPDLAVRRPAGSPYSVAEVVAHMAFWQDRFLRKLDGETLSPVTTAADGWPAVSAEGWPALVDRYLNGLERYRAIAADGELLRRPLGDGGTQSVGLALLDFFVHDAHHLGQVVLLRRILGAWPPPGGGATW